MLDSLREGPRGKSVEIRGPFAVILHAPAYGELVQKLGGRLIDAYYCFGEYDVVVLLELPDDTAATALAMAAISPGHLKAYKTTKLFTVEETMEAMRKAGSLAFQGPSKG